MSHDLHKESKEQLIRRIQLLDHENSELKQRLHLAKAAKVVKLKHVLKKESIFQTCEFIQIALKIAYVGIEYSGFAQQSTVPHTIEEYLFNALKKTLLIQAIDTAYGLIF